MTPCQPSRGNSIQLSRERIPRGREQRLPGPLFSCSICSSDLACVSNPREEGVLLLPVAKTESVHEVQNCIDAEGQYPRPEEVHEEVHVA